MGILICGRRIEHVRYALGQAESPLAVSTYIHNYLPRAENKACPTAEQEAFPAAE